MVGQPTAASLATLVADSNLLSPWVKQHGTSAHQLLHHFSNNSAVIMGAPMNPLFWDLACSHSFLVSTMLAVSACHLRHYTANPGPHRIAELGQESAAIAALKPALEIPLVQKDRADALLVAAVMLNAVNFAFVESRSPSTSWVFSDSDDRLGWLDLQLGFKKLEEATIQFRESRKRLLPQVLESPGPSPGPTARRPPPTSLTSPRRPPPRPEMTTFRPHGETCLLPAATVRYTANPSRL